MSRNDWTLSRSLCGMLFVSILIAVNSGDAYRYVCIPEQVIGNGLGSLQGLIVFVGR